MTIRSPLAATAVGLFGVAAAATACDYAWYEHGIRHRMTAGVVHGVVLLTAVGLVLGWARGRVVRGMPIGALAGLGGALTYYLLIAVLGGATYGASIPAAWVAMWLILAALDGRWLRVPARAWGAIAARGLAAAVLGGLAFFLVLRTLWGPPPASGRNYFVQFLAWAFAWAPGLVALTVGDGVRRPFEASAPGS